MAKHPLDGCDFSADVPRGTPLLVEDYQGRVWRLTRKGVRYHEDVGTLLHGARPAKAPPAMAASMRLRALIERAIAAGRDSAIEIVEPPELTWTDQVPGSYAQRPYLEVLGDVVRAIRPVYDDAPRVGWVRLTARESAKLRADLAIAPNGVQLPVVHVSERTVMVPADHPLVSALEAHGVRRMYDGGPIMAPVTLWRRLTGQ